MESFEKNYQESLEHKNIRERLERLVPVFLEIRAQMGVGENIGFGSLREVHGEERTLGSLPDIRRSKKGEIKYSIPGFLGQVQQEPLSSEEAKNILVMPKPSGKRERIVSIYDPDEDLGERIESLVDAPDEIIIGLIAHELAHSYDAKTKFPSKILSVLEKLHKEEQLDSKDKWKYDTTNEPEIEIIAALFGYKEQIIAKIDFMLNRLNQFGPYLRGKQYMIESLEFRKQQVIKYCS